VKAYGYTSECYDKARGCGNSSRGNSSRCDARTQMPGWTSRLPGRCHTHAEKTLIDDEHAGLWLQPQKDWFALGECSGCFEDMTAEKQQALLVLGTDRNCWNSPAKANGINCSASLEERKGMYDAIQRKFARSARSVWHFPEQRRFAIVTIYASMLMSFSGLVVFVALRHGAWNLFSTDNAITGEESQLRLVQPDGTDLEMEPLLNCL